MTANAAIAAGNALMCRKRGYVSRTASHQYANRVLLSLPNMSDVFAFNRVCYIYSFQKIICICIINVGKNILFSNIFLNHIYFN